MKKAMNITVEESVMQKLGELSEQLGISRSAVVSAAVMQYAQQMTVINNLPGILGAWSEFQKLNENKVESGTKNGEVENG